MRAWTAEAMAARLEHFRFECLQSTLGSVLSHPNFRQHLVRECTETKNAVSRSRRTRKWPRLRRGHKTTNSGLCVPVLRLTPAESGAHQHLGFKNQRTVLQGFDPPCEPPP